MQNFISAVEWLEKYLVNYPKDKVEQTKKIEAEQQQKMVDDALTNYELGWVDRKKQFSLYEHKETITSADTPTSSQTEISDEEIEKSAKEWYEKEGRVNYNAEIRAWVMACKWYREQLKKKQ